MTLHIDPDSGAGTLSIDGAETRRLDVVALMSHRFFFAGYGEGDEKPVLEVLTPRKSLVAHIGGSGDHSYLYVDIRVKGVDPAERLRCD